MTAVWFIYYIVRMFKKQDTVKDALVDALLVLPCLVIDALIFVMIVI